MWMVHGVSSQDKKDLAEQFSASPKEVEQTHSVSAELLALEDLQPFLPSLRLTEQSHHIRIDLIDLNENALFNVGSLRPNERGRAMLSAVGTAISVLPYSVRIEGHTDSMPISGNAYSNWDLSTGRANAARRVLIEAGLDQAQVAAVIGLADTQPLHPEAPDLPANRRISIVLELAPASA